MHPQFMDSSAKETSEPCKSGSGRGRKRSDATHMAIIQAARDILQESGFAGLSMEAVARRSKAGKPTIYRWWPSKGELVMEVYDKLADEAIDPIDEGNLQKDLEVLLTRLWDFWTKTSAGEAFVALIASAQSDPEVMPLFRDAFLPLRRRGTKEILHRACARGEMRKDADIDLLVDVSFGFNWYRLLTKRPPEQAEIRLLAAVLTQGFAPAPA